MAKTFGRSSVQGTAAKFIESFARKPHIFLSGYELIFQQPHYFVG
jgi:hypothetical protein